MNGKPINRSERDCEDQIIKRTELIIGGEQWDLTTEEVFFNQSFALKQTEERYRERKIIFFVQFMNLEKVYHRINMKEL